MDTPEEKSTFDIISEQLELFDDVPRETLEETPVVEEQPVVEEPVAEEPPKMVSEEEYRELQSRYEQVAPAEQFIKYIQEMGLSQEDVHRALELATLYNVDPKAALESLNPIHDQLAVAAGERLSPEVQALVDNGEMTEYAAQQYQQALVEKQRYEAQQQRSMADRQAYEAAQQQRDAAERQQYFTALQTNASTWEQRVAQSDPDYNAPLYEGGLTKGQEVVKELQYLVQTQGLPRDLNEQNSLLNTAYETVNKKINALRGANTMRSTPRASSRGVAEPPALEMGKVSTLDIIRRQLNVG